jgi:hypothetical protein
MNYSDKIVIEIPLKSIWNDFEQIAGIREQYLDKEKIILDNYLNSYVYLASEWKIENSSSIILLEMFH